MHTRLLGTPFLALTLAVVLSAACRDNPGATGTTGTGVGVRVSQIDLGRSLNADKTINDNTDTFKPDDAIYASIATEGYAQTATLTARWTYQDGQVVNESTQTITPTGNARTEFHISKPDGWPPGKYKLEAFVNGSSSATKDFEVTRYGSGVGSAGRIRPALLLVRIDCQSKDARPAGARTRPREGHRGEERSPPFILPHVHALVNAREFQGTRISPDDHVPERHRVGPSRQRRQGAGRP